MEIFSEFVTALISSGMQNKYATDKKVCRHAGEKDWSKNIENIFNVCQMRLFTSLTPVFKHLSFHSKVLDIRSSRYMTWFCWYFVFLPKLFRLTINSLINSNVHKALCYSKENRCFIQNRIAVQEINVYSSFCRRTHCIPTIPVMLLFTTGNKECESLQKYYNNRNYYHCC